MPTSGKKVHAVVLGAAGYGGGELLRLLGAHPSVIAITAASRSHAGQPFHAAHPHLRGIVEGAFVAEPDWKRKAASVDAGIAVVVFAALPHGELGARYPDLAAQWAGAGIEDAITVIDLSGDHRLADAAAYARHYGTPHPHPANLGAFVYGLPEWQRAKLRAAKRIANPGCFATGLQLALLPLLAAGVAPEWVAASGTTGSSGSGALPSDTTHPPTRANDYRAYKPLVHQHLGEVEQLIAAFTPKGGRAAQVAFVPHSAPLVRGVSCTVQLRVADAAFAAEKVKAFYDHEPFVRVVEGAPRLAAVAGGNFCDLGVAAAGDQLVVMTALDNLVKGMTGNAVQNMNLALGLDERMGLMQAPIFP